MKTGQLTEQLKYQNIAAKLNPNQRDALRNLSLRGTHPGAHGRVLRRLRLCRATGRITSLGREVDKVLAGRT